MLDLRQGCYETPFHPTDTEETNFSINEKMRISEIRIRLANEQFLLRKKNMFMFICRNSECFCGDILNFRKSEQEL